MSLNAIMNTASSGLQAAQTQLRVVSDNVSNVNTPGYVRKLADQTAYKANGVGVGVDIARIRRAAAISITCETNRDAHAARELKSN